MKRILKYIFRFFIGLFILLLILPALLYIPGIQNFAKNKAIEILSEKTGWRITAEKVRLSFPLRFAIKEVSAITGTNDTIFYLSSLETGVALRPLFHKEVKIRSVSLFDAKVNMVNMIDGMDITGHIGEFTVAGLDADLDTKQALVRRIILSGSEMNMEMFQSKEDTTKKASTPLDWQFSVGALKVIRSGYAMKDSVSGLDLACFINNGQVQNIAGRLSDNTYTASELLIEDSSYKMNLDTLPPVKGFDFAHMVIHNVNLKADSIYNQGIKVKARILQGSMEERSGFRLSALEGKYEMDSTMMALSGFLLRTPYSKITADGFINQDVFKSPRKGKADLVLKGEVGKEDIVYFGTPYLPELEKAFPQESLILDLSLQGDMERLNLKQLLIEQKGHYRLFADGYLRDLSNQKKTAADIQIDGLFPDLSFVPHLFPDTALHYMMVVPNDISLNGNLLASEGQYTGALTLSHLYSKITLNGTFHPEGEVYSATISADTLDLSTFLPTTGIGLVTAQLKANGAGFNPMLPASRADLNLDVRRFDINQYSLRSFTLDGTLKNSLYDLKFGGNDSILKMNLAFVGKLTEKEITSSISGQIQNIDFQKLNLYPSPLKLALDLDADVNTNLKDSYNLDANFNNILLTDNGVSNKLGNLYTGVHISKDSTKVKAVNGDMNLDFYAVAGLDSLLTRINGFTSLLDRQFKERSLNIDLLQKQLPQINMLATAGNQNILYGWVKSKGMQFKNVNMKMSSGYTEGIHLDISANQFRKDTLLFGAIDFDLIQKGDGFEYSFRANALHKDPAKAFKASVEGEIRDKAISVHINEVNGKGLTGFNVGASLAIEEKGLLLRFNPYDPVMFYKDWTINPDNYIYLSHENKIRADFILTGEKGMALKILSAESQRLVESEAVNIFLENINLDVLSADFELDPPFSGNIDAAFNVEMVKDKLDAMGNLRITSLFYNKQRLGNLSLDLDFLTGKGLGQHANAKILLDGREVATAKMEDVPNDSVGLQASLLLNYFPINLANPFIPQAMASLSGVVSGDITVSGNLSEPVMNGYLDFDNGTVNISYANADYKLDENRLIIENSTIFFNRYEIMAYNKNPLVINGTFDFRNLSQMTTDLRITGQNVELLNVKRQKNQMVFGRMNMNVNTTVKGPLDFMQIRGSMNLLAGTDITYVMLNGTVSAQDRISNLVEFTSFTDTIQSNYKVDKKPVTLSGIDMLVTIGIAPMVKMAIDLSPSGDDHVELVGGGDLAFRLSPMGETDLSGRYNLSGGYVRYQLPILPVAKTFDIRSGSYVEWSGKMLDPFVNITAYERIRSTVTEEGQNSRVVNFDAVIKIQNRLEDLDVVFTVEAPDDMTIQNQIASMTAEERSRQAMNLIITNSYTGPGTTAKLNANNALSSFIQKEINQFAGSALKGVDLSFGIDTYNEYDASGQGGQRTDYSFKFSKTLFNDRFRIVVGGTVSSGQQSADQQDQAFIDDVTLEYMLDQSGTRYLKLFHHTGYESVLEGEVVETGIGIVLKRKIRKLRQLFIFNERKRRNAINSGDKTNDNKDAK